jgi:hypothetical protein
MTKVQLPVILRIFEEIHILKKSNTCHLPPVNIKSEPLNTFYAPATKSRGHINLPPVRPSVHPDIDTWFVRLSPPTVLELQL